MRFDINDIKAGIVYAGLTAGELAESLGMGASNLSLILAGKTNPHEDTKRRIVRKLEDRGVEFLMGGGVRPRQSDVMVYEGVEGWKAFSDDRYYTALNSSQDFLFCGGLQDSFATTAGAAYQKWNIERMQSISHFKMRALRPESYKKPAVAPYIEYRVIPDKFFPSSSFYVYGGKLALLRFDPDLRIYVVQDRAISEGYRTQFESLWTTAKAPRDNHD